MSDLPPQIVEIIRYQYEAGDKSIKRISADQGVSDAGLRAYARAKGWQRAKPQRIIRKSTQLTALTAVDDAPTDGPILSTIINNVLTVLATVEPRAKKTCDLQELKLLIDAVLAGVQSIRRAVQLPAATNDEEPEPATTGFAALNAAEANPGVLEGMVREAQRKITRSPLLKEIYETLDVVPTMSRAKLEKRLGIETTKKRAKNSKEKTEKAPAMDPRLRALLVRTEDLARDILIRLVEFASRKSTRDNKSLSDINRAATAVTDIARETLNRLGETAPADPKPFLFPAFLGVGLIAQMISKSPSPLLLSKVIPAIIKA